MASNMNLNVNDNGFRASKLLLNGGGYLTKQMLLQHAIKGTTTNMDEFLADINVKQNIQTLKAKNVIKGSQSNILYPSNGNPTNLDEWDITLVTLILNNCCSLSQVETDAIKDIRELRNTLYGHTAKVEMAKAEFEQKWKIISSTLTKYVSLLADPTCAQFIKDLIAKTERETLSEDKNLDTLKRWYEWGFDVDLKFEEINEEQKTSFVNAETKCDERHRETQDGLSKIETSQSISVNKLSSIQILIEENKGHNVDRTELNRKKKQAINILAAHRRHLLDFGVPCETQETVTELLNKNKIVVLKGVPGSGKTHLAKNVLNNFLCLKRTIDPLILSKPTDIERVLDPDGSFVLLIDDMIGKISFESTECKEWSQYMETFMSQVQVGQLYVVVTIRTAIFRQCQNEDISNMFKKCSIIDTDTCLAEKEKRQILEVYRKYHEIEISDDQADQIVKQQSAGIGFPLLCTIIQGNDTEELFKHPTKSLQSMISPTTSKDPALFAALFMTLIGDNTMSKSKNKLLTNQTESFEALQTFFKTTNMDIFLLYQTADKFETTFISWNENENQFTFIHEAVAHATFVVALTLVPDILIKWCPIQVLIMHMNLISEPSAVGLNKPNPCLVHKHLIINKMVETMSLKTCSNVKVVASATIWNEGTFVNEALCMFGDTDFLSQTDEQGMSMICYFAGNGLSQPLEIFVERIQKRERNKCVEHLQKALIEACVSSEKECVDILIAKVDISCNVVIAAVKGGHLDIVQQIINLYGADKIKGLKEEDSGETLLHIAAKTGRIDVIKYLYRICPSSLQTVDKKGCNVTHSSADSVSKRSIECLTYFINLGLNPRRTNYKGESIFHKAIIAGNVSTAKFIYETYPDMLHITDKCGSNALHCAACNGNVDCIKFLVSQGINPGDENDDQNTILHQSALGANMSTLKYICKAYPEMLHKRNKDGFNVLHIIAVTGMIDCAKFVVDEGINPNDKTGNEATILHISALYKQKDTMKYICETYPELLCKTDIDGNTALHYAAEEGSIECMKLLVEQGINPGDQNNIGDTILHKSASGGHVATLKYIYETFPELVHATDNLGSRTLINRTQCLQFLDDEGKGPEIMTKCGTLGGNISTMQYICETYTELINLTNIYGYTALHYAAINGSVECMKFLLNRGIDAEVSTKCNETILHLSASGRNIATMKCIHERYPNMLHLTDINGLNSLHKAVVKGNTVCMKFLIDHGIDPEVKTKCKETILHLSAFSRNRNAMKFIHDTYPDMLHVTNIHGHTALHNAAEDGTVECMQFFIDQGINTGEKTYTKETILHRSALGGNITTMKYIHEKYPDMLHVTSVHGHTALHHAAQGGTVECMKFLVDQGIYHGIKTKNEETILHLSAVGGNITTMKYIHETFPDMLHVTDKNGYNALQKAAVKGSTICMIYLIDQGLDPEVKTQNKETILHLSAYSKNLTAMKYIHETYPDMLHLTDTRGHTVLHDAAHIGSIECMKFLIKHGIYPAVKTNNDETILLLSALGGNITTMKYIHETYSDMLHATDINGNTALHIAAAKGTFECVKFLIDQGIDPGVKTKFEESILHTSALGGNINTMKYIHEAYPDMLYVTDIQGNTVLHNAAYIGSIECMKFLINQGIDPEVKTNNEVTILHLSALGGNIATVKYIYETYPAMLHVTDINGQNALYKATVKGCTVCMKYLIDQGIEPDVNAKHEATILHLSAICGNITTMKYIHETFPDMLHGTDINGLNALHLATIKGCTVCMKFLIDKGINPELKTKNEINILHLSALVGNITTMKYIHETFPDMLHVTDNNGHNALHKAAMKGSTACMKYLIDQGLDPEVKTKNEVTILHLSAVGGNITTMKYIHETFPHMLHATDIHRNTALHIAAAKGTFECIEFLVDQGIDPEVKTKNEETILHLSAVGGNITTMKCIRNTYPDMLHVTDINGHNALHKAAAKGTFECIQFLVDQGMEPGVKTNNDNTILHISALFGNVATMKYINETYPDMLHATNINGHTALHIAAAKDTFESLRYLIDQGIHQEVKTKNEETVLHRSVLSGNIATMKYIHKTHPEMLHVTDIHGNTALHHAAEKGTVECMKFLVDKGIDPDVKTKNEETILHRSALSGNVAKMRYIHETYPSMLHITDIHGNTALHHAAEKGTVECMKFLVDKGIDPEVKTKNEETILHRSALSGNVAKMRYIHETYPSMLHITDIHGNTALHYAAETGTVECMKFLVGQRIDSGVKNKNEETILHRSALNGYVAIMKYILETYPSILQTTDIHGNTALHHAAHRGTVECMKFLVDKGIDPRVKNKNEESILHLSALSGNEATMKFIHETYPSMLHITDIHGNTVLHNAAYGGTVECMKFLVDKGIDPRVKNKNEESILHRSALSGNVATMKFLHETYPSMLHITDIHGKTALHNAAYRGTVECMKYLVDKGIDPGVKTKNEETILHRSALSGNVATMKYILDTCPEMLHSTDINGRNILHITAAKGTIECVKFLIDQGIDPCVITKNEETILHQSVFGGNRPTMKYIHETYPDMLQVTDIHGNTALHYAAYRSNVECMKFLVDQRIDSGVKNKIEETILHRSALSGNVATMKFIHETYPSMLHTTDIHGNTALHNAAYGGTVECMKYLVDKGIDPEVKTKYDETLLHRSALNGNESTMKFLHETYPSMLHITDIHGNTALHHAAYGSNVECMKFLVDQRIDSGVKNKNEETILHRSALSGNVATMKYIHETCPSMLQTTDIHGNTALHNAAYGGTVECMKFLVDKGIDPRVKNKNEESILHRSALSGNVATMKFLHETYPSMLHITDIHGNTALHNAAYGGTVECMKFLVDKGIDPRVKNKNEESILHRSALSGNVATMKFLHETYPSMLHITDIHGKTALHNAAYRGTVECMKYLVDKGIDPGVKTKNEETILHRSALSGNVATMKYILDTCPEMLHSTDINGRNILHITAAKGTIECVKFLIDQGIDPCVITKNEETILHQSVFGGNRPTMKYIHETYPDMLQVTDIHGNTALHYAAYRSNVECMKFLVDQRIDSGVKNKIEETILHRSALSGNVATMKFIHETYPSMLHTTDIHGNTALHNAAYGGTVECMKYLVDKGIDPEVKTKYDETLLHRSALNGNESTMKFLHETYPSMLHITDIHRNTALHHAAYGSNVECMKFLVDQRIDSGVKNKNEETILHRSALSGNVATMKYIHETCPSMLQTTDIHGNTALHNAAYGGTVECMKYLVDKGIDPEVKTKNEETILHRSALSGNVAKMRYIHETYPSMLHITDIHGNTALHHAAEKGTVECMKFLVDKGIDPEVKTKNEETILHRSALSGNVAKMRYIHETYPSMLHITDIHGNTALHYAAETGTVECMKFLVGQRIDSGVKNKNEETILHRSALSGYVAIMKYILETYPSILQTTDIHGNTALHHAAHRGTVECVKFLVDKGIDPRVKNKNEESILHLSALSGNEATMKFIHETYPSMLHITDIHGNTALHNAANGGTVECMKFLVDKGIDPRVKNKNEESILHRSALSGNVATMKFLHETYPSMLHITDIHGNTALHNAAYRGTVECMKYLVDNGIDPGVKTNNEETILHRSALSGNVATMKYILDTCPEMLHSTDINGRNILHITAAKGTIECVKFLIDQGIDPCVITKNEETILHQSVFGGNRPTMKYIHETYPDMLQVTDIHGNTTLHHAAYRSNVECMKFLVDQRIDSEVKNKIEETILHRSALSGNVATMKFIHETYPSMLQTTDIHGNTALHNAAYGGTVECMKYLVDKGIDPEVKTKYDETLLHRSALNGNEATMKFLHETYPNMLHITDIHGNTALHHAAYGSNVECMKFLVDQRIDSGVKNKNEETILHRSALSGNVATMKYIHETCPSMLQTTDIHGNTALHNAAYGGTVACMKYLVDKGIDPEVKTKNEETILHRSALSGNVAKMRYIHETYPNMLHATNIHGNTALHHAAEGGTVECMEFLVDQGIYPGITNTDEETILHRSALSGNIPTMKFIHETWPDMLHATDIHGNTALHHAAARGTVECMKFLVDKGIDPEVKTKNEETILHRSALSGNVAKMRYIHETYPNMLHATNIHGNTALHHAAGGGTVECMEFLVDQGIYPGITNTYEETILHRSAVGGNITTLKYIHETYPDMLHITDIHGNTAVHDAALRGTVECVKLLVDQGIVPGIKTKNEETILHRSAVGGNIATMKYIHKTYPNMLHATNIHGNTALHHAAEVGTVECMEFLVDQGIYPGITNTDEETILHRSAVGGNITTLKYIHETYPDMLHITDIHGNTAVHDAALRGTVECVKLLVDQGIVPGIKTKNEETILHRSAVGGNIATMKYIHKTYPNMLHATNIHGNTALHHAAEGGTVECMEFLVDQGIYPGITNTDEETILHRSAVGGNITTLKYINETYPNMLHATDIYCNSVLHDAAERGSVECMEYIVDHGIDPGIKTKNEETILHRSAIGGNIATMKYIHETFSDMLHDTDIDGNTALHEAAEGGTVECMEYLVDQGIDPDIKTIKKETILHRSAFGGNIATMKYIHETFSDMLHATAIHGNTALHKAAERGTVECTEYLVDQGIDPRIKTKSEETILHRSAIGGNITTMKYIHETFSDMLHDTDIDGNTALHEAAEGGTVECMEYLVDQGIDPDIKTIKEETILHRSAVGGNLATMEYIQETFFDMLHDTDIDGNTALHEAAEGGTVECMEYLVDQGIDPGITNTDEETILHRSAVGGNIETVKYISETYPTLLHLTDNRGNNSLHCASVGGNIDCITLLIDKGINYYDINNDKKTILHLSAFSRNMATVKYICKTFPELLHFNDKCYKSALHDAVIHGTVECIKFLIEYGINPKAKTFCEETILHFSANGENIANAKYICETYPDLLHLKDNSGNNALHEAARKGTVECMKFLIDTGIHHNDSNYENETILHMSAIGGNILTMKYICETYWDLLHLTSDNRGNNALHDAALYGTCECVKLLVEWGLDSGVKTSNGKTILHQAALGGNMGTVRYICEYFPELLHITDDSGKNALHDAERNATGECAQFLIGLGLLP